MTTMNPSYDVFLSRPDAEIIINQNEVVGKERAAAFQLHKIKEQDYVLEQWLEGKTLSTIASNLNCTPEHAGRTLRKMQAEIRDVVLGERENLVIDNIQAFRHIKDVAFEHVKRHPAQAPQLLTVALRAQEAIGKIQGVLTERVHHLGSIEHLHKKLYDFEDTFPTIDGTIRDLPMVEVQLEALPEGGEAVGTKASSEGSDIA